MQQPAGSETALPMRLRDLRENYRPLLIFAASQQDVKFLEQMHMLSTGAADLLERQMIIIPLIADGQIGTSAKALNPVLPARLVAEEAIVARRRFHVSPTEFTIILIGKDGGEKFCTHNPVTIKRLNTIIDAMPMRQQEIKDGHPE